MVEFGRKIPVSIQPMFWFLSLLIGFLYGRGDPISMLTWILIVFISVLFHEYGHALMAILFRQKAKIQLMFFGGLTSFDGPKLKMWQQFLIVLNGPLFGFLLFLCATILLKIQLFSSSFMVGFLQKMQIANLFWTILNLLPVQPLDGGHLLRIALEGFFSVKGYRASLLIGAVFSAGLVGVLLLTGAFLAAAIFTMFAFESFELWRKSKFASADDRSQEVQKDMLTAELAFQKGDFEKSEEMFLKVMKETRAGVIKHMAHQYLALLYMKKGRHKLAYDLLLECEDDLMDDSRCLLHQLAAEFDNDALVCALSQRCYQLAPSFQMAMRSARSFGKMKNPKLAGGWLCTAWSYGVLDLNQTLNEPPFCFFEQDPEFKFFVSQMQKK